MDHGELGRDNATLGSGNAAEKMQEGSHRRASTDPHQTPLRSVPLSGHTDRVTRNTIAHGEDNGAGQQSDSEAETVVLPTPQRHTSARWVSEPERHADKESQQIPDNHGMRLADEDRNDSGNQRGLVWDAFARQNSHESNHQPPTPKHSSDSDDGLSPNSTAFQPSYERVARETSQLLPRKRKLGERAAFDGTARKLRPQHRSATHDPPRRSPSPPGAVHRRAASMQLGLSNGQSHSMRTRQSPTSSIKRNEREQSDSSSVAMSPQPQVQIKRRERSMASPADTTSHKTHKRKGDLHGRTALYRACEEGWSHLVPDLLHQRPEDLDKPDHAGNTPLQTAALGGYADIVNLLIEAGCQTDCVNSDRDTPLIDAIENSHFDVVRLLLDAGVDPRRPNLKGERPLDLLHKVDDDVQADMKSALMSAINRSALQFPPDEHATSYSAGSRAPSVESPRRSPSMSRSPPFFSEYQPRRKTRRGATHRKDLMYLHMDTQTLKEYAGKGDGEAVEYLLNGGVKADNHCMVAAAQGDHIGVMNSLLAEGGDADPDPETCNYETPLLATIGRGNLEMLQLLVSQEKFNPSRPDRKGKYYDEIARDREGPNWHAEVEILKRAFDEHPSHAARQSPHQEDKQQADKLHRPKRKISIDSPSIKRDSAAKRHKSEKHDRNGHDPVRPKRRSESDSFTTIDISKPKRKLVSNGYREQKRHSIAIVSDSDSEDDDLPPSRRAVKSELRSPPFGSSSYSELPSSPRPRRVTSPNLTRAVPKPRSRSPAPPVPIPISEEDDNMHSLDPSSAEEATGPSRDVRQDVAQDAQLAEAADARHKAEIESQLEVIRKAEAAAEAKKIADEQAKAKAEAAYQRLLSLLPRFSVIILIPRHEIESVELQAEHGSAEPYMLLLHAAVLLGLDVCDRELLEGEKIPTTEAQRLFMLPHYREMMTWYVQSTPHGSGSGSPEIAQGIDQRFMEMAMYWVSFNFFLTTVREGLQNHRFEHLRDFELTTRTSVHVDWVTVASKDHSGTLTRAQLLHLNSQGLFGVLAAAEAKKLEAEPGVYVDGMWKESVKASRHRRSQQEGGRRWL